MPYSLRTFTCPDCGQASKRRAPADYAGHCTACRVEHSAENARQLHAGKGPYFDRWAWACAAAAMRIKRAVPASGARRAA